jgi:hypothetical protein
VNKLTIIIESANISADDLVEMLKEDICLEESIVNCAEEDYSIISPKVRVTIITEE